MRDSSLLPVGVWHIFHSIFIADLLSWSCLALTSTKVSCQCLGARRVGRRPGSTGSGRTANSVLFYGQFRYRVKGHLWWILLENHSSSRRLQRKPGPASLWPWCRNSHRPHPQAGGRFTVKRSLKLGGPHLPGHGARPWKSLQQC